MHIVSPMNLSEGISNLEDLDAPAFIDAVRRLKTMQVSERLDGTRLWIGVDEKGRVFTSRPNAAPSSRALSTHDYPYLASNNAPRAAAAAITEVEDVVRETLKPGETVEANVILGRQPSVVAYGLNGKNYIVIIDGVSGTSDAAAEALSKALKGRKVDTRFITVQTSDGETLERKLITAEFVFEPLKQTDASKLSGLKIEPLLKKFEAFLKEPSTVRSLSNQELLMTPLTSIPKEERASVKSARAALSAEILTKFKSVITKEILSRLVRSARSSLSADDLTPEEDVGVQGVVLKDGTTGARYKVTDGSTRKALLAFNNAVRARLGGVVRSIDADASLEARGGVVGQMFIRISELLGNKELALPRAAKDFFLRHRGDTPAETLRNVAKELRAPHDFNEVKNKTLAILSATLTEVSHQRAEFVKHRDSADAFRLVLPSGKTITLSKEQQNHTMLAFAEARRNLMELQEKVQRTKAFNELVSVLYGRIARAASASDEKPIVESLELLESLEESRSDVSTLRFSEIRDAWTLQNIYLATMMMATVIYKADDKRGIRLLRDKAHARMLKLDTEMSPVNFWGFANWKAGTAAKKYLAPKVSHDAGRIAKRVPHAWVNWMHLDYSYAHHLPIKFQDHYKTLKFFVKNAYSVNADRVNTLLDGVFAYDTLTFDEKVKLLPKLYFYVMQFVPTSPLLVRVRAIQNKLLGTGSDDDGSDVQMAPRQKLLGEDGEIAAGPSAGPAAVPTPAASAPSQTTGATTAGAISSREIRSTNVVKRKRTGAMQELIKNSILRRDLK